MKYRTYIKLRSKYKTIRRAAFIAIAVIFVAWLVITVLTFTHYDATAATNDEVTGGITVEMFTPIECELSEELQEYTYYICRSYNVEFELAMAIMYTESAFDTEAASYTGDYGLMQINEINLPELTDKLGITDITNPYQNIRSGAYLLGKLTAKYDDPARVIMSYNMGEYGAASLWEEGIQSTAYAEKVLAKYKEYKEANYGRR